jgi:drug/metabolite transporter (DMT)-like permease
VDRQRWLAIGAGLSGVVFILDPSAAALTSLGALGALASATAYSLSAILVRLMVRTDTSVSMVFSMLLLLSVLAGALAAPDWQPVRAQDWPWIAVLGATGGLGQHFITRAFVHAPASLVAPFEYTALLWAIAIDWAIWDVVPGSRLFAGSAIIIGAGLYLIARERALHKEIAASIESPASLH